MPTLVFPKQTLKGENRCAVLPANVKAYKLLGVDVMIESGLGHGIHVTDEQFEQAGAQIVTSRETLLQSADVVLGIHKLPQAELTLCRAGSLMISYLDPFNAPEYLDELCKHQLTSISMEMIPRISRCQKMDALSSQASLAGYVMVALAMSTLPSVLPMMMTPAGTLKPAKVFVIGAGVAGLQAIATAKRLGAAVTAFDTRSVVAEQVQSLGAKFLQIDLGETSQNSQGYAQSLSTEQMQKQQAGQAKCIAESDIVITTAQLFGRKPPLLIDADTIAQMQPGSVIVDMAAENGGNVAGSVAGETVMVDGVSLIGTGNWANQVAKDASQMYASNLFNLFSEFCNQDTASVDIDLQDEILSNCVITHQGDIVNQTIVSHFKKEVV